MLDCKSSMELPPTAPTSTPPRIPFFQTFIVGFDAIVIVVINDSYTSVSLHPLLPSQNDHAGQFIVLRTNEKHPPGFGYLTKKQPQAEENQQ